MKIYLIIIKNQMFNLKHINVVNKLNQNKSII